MKPRSRLSRRELLALAALPTAAVCGWGLREFAGRRITARIDASRDEAPAALLPDTPEIHRLKRFSDAIEPLYSRMPPPADDEWLAGHTEFGQTFAQFLFGKPEKLCERYVKIGFVPIGKFSDTQRLLLVDAAEYLPRFFGFPVELLEPVALDDLPDDAERTRESGTRQVLTSHLRNRILLPRRSDEMAAIVGLTASDLWDAGFNFLFGQASLKDRISVCSVARFGDVDAGEVDYATCLRRTLGVIVHETGHAFGLPHCIAYLCRMSGSNHLRESDRRPLDFCPECLPKIWWTCGLDPYERFAKLSEFADERRLVIDGKLWHAAVARLRNIHG